MPDRIVFATISFAVFILVLGIPVLADNREPSDPAHPIQGGALDLIRSIPAGEKPRFPCVGYDVVINLNQHAFKTRYIKFWLENPESKIEFRMRENPKASLWFNLLREDLSLIQQYKGGANQDNQIFDRSNLQANTNFFVQIETDGTVSRLPDNTNRAFVVFRGWPRGIADRLAGKSQTNPISLGTLNAGTPIRRNDSVFVYAQRELVFQPTATNPNCPDATGENSGFAELYREYTIQAGPGEILVQYTITASQNWTNQLPFGAGRWVGYPQQWGRVEGLPFRHPGGELKLRVGKILDTPSIPVPDAYVGYELVISYLRMGGATPNQNPGGVPTSVDLSTPFRNPRIIIGPVDR